MNPNKCLVVSRLLAEMYLITKGESLCDFDIIRFEGFHPWETFYIHSNTIKWVHGIPIELSQPKYPRDYWSDISVYLPYRVNFKGWTCRSPCYGDNYPPISLRCKELCEPDMKYCKKHAEGLTGNLPADNVRC